MLCPSAGVAKFTDNIRMNLHPTSWRYRILLNARFHHIVPQWTAYLERVFKENACLGMHNFMDALLRARKLELFDWHHRKILYFLFYIRYLNIVLKRERHPRRLYRLGYLCVVYLRQIQLYQTKNPTARVLDSFSYNNDKARLESGVKLRGGCWRRMVLKKSGSYLDSMNFSVLSFQA